MKAKTVRGAGFRGVLDYALNKEGSEIVAGTMAGETPRELATEFGEIRKLRPNIKRPVWHCSLALPKNESLTPEQWQEISNAFLARMGIDPTLHQWVAVQHHDTEHAHVHLIVNRIRPDGKVWGYQNDVYKAISVTRDMEKDFRMTITPGREAKEFCVPSFTRGEIEAFKRTGEPDSKIIVARAVSEVTANGPIPIQSFIELMEAQDIHAVPNIAKTTGRMNGFSFEYNGVALKGSDVSASWKHLSEVVLYDRERDEGSLQAIRDAYRTTRDAEGRHGGDGLTTGTGDGGTGEPATGTDRSANGTGSEDQSRYGDLFEVGEGLVDTPTGDTDSDRAPDGDRGAVAVEAPDVDMDGTDGLYGWDSVLDVASGLTGTKQNPLQVDSTDGRREPMTSKSVAYKRSVWQRQSEALGAPLYRVTVRGRGKQDGRTINLCKEKNGTETLWSADMVSDQIPTLEFWNAKGHDVYVTPIDDAQHHILIDDLTETGVDYIKANYHPTIVCASSAGNWQAIVIVPKAEVSTAEQSAGNALMQKLNRLPDGCGGDRSISAVRHPFRMAGFRNKKPGRDDFQTKIELWQPGLCPNAEAEMEVLRTSYAHQNTQERERFMDEAGQGELPTALYDYDTAEGTEEEAFRAFAREWNRAKGLHAQHPEWGEADPSRWDFRATRHLIERGYGEDTARKAIRRCSPNVYHRHTNAWEYALKTVASVLLAITCEVAREVAHEMER